MIGSFLGTWKGYIILSVISFSSSGREVGLFYHFITLIFFIFLRITFVKKIVDVAILKWNNIYFLLSNTSMFYFISFVDNANLFVTASISTFPGNKSCLQSCHKLFQLLSVRFWGCFNFFPTFSKNIWTKSCQKVELNICKVMTAVACQEFLPILSRNCSAFYFQQ